ncbi:hypothetical protein [Rhizobium leguminosarum]|uniref:hypothetical protein n=1 Tax=Rhizobium leguminosarum TaxID=384 RepID=UPI0013B9A828|nr:hypothetical protein [Rhizobium leguminosarum]NEI66545.1 hypothetical protein [Rhizobium leguminosarum]
MPIGRVIRRSVETHLALGDRLAQVEADMREVRGLHSEIKASLSEIAEFIARRERDYRLALAGNDRDVAEEIFAGDVMDEVRTYDDEDVPFDDEDAR